MNKGICDIHVIDVYLTRACNSTWVFDTGSIANICNSKQGLWIKRRLANNKVTMRVGNGSEVEAVQGETLLPGQNFIFGGFALRANSLGHLEQIESYALAIKSGLEA